MCGLSSSMWNVFKSPDSITTSRIPRHLMEKITLFVQHRTTWFVVYLPLYHEPLGQTYDLRYRIQPRFR